MNWFRFLPLSSPWIIRHHLGRAKTILDVGCGEGSLMAKVNSDKGYEVVGIDLHLPYLKTAKATGVYKKLEQKDIKDICLPDKSFDAVLAYQVIEHLNKKDALKLLNKMEKIARQKVIIATPKGFVKYDPFEVIDDNKLQEHKSGWEAEEMKKFGYKVYGQGSSFIYRPTGLLYKYRRLKNILVLISYLLSPLSYFIPETSAYIIAVKEV